MARQAAFIKVRGFTAGMRGHKGSQYDGGHRVPMIMRWPAGNVEAGKSVPTLAAHVDMLPTFIDLCDLKAPEIAFDGTSIRDLIYGDGDAWPGPQPRGGIAAYCESRKVGESVR